MRLTVFLLTPVIAEIRNLLPASLGDAEIYQLFSCARRTAGSYFGPSGVGAAKVHLLNLDVLW
jgi:hypothetical protein